MSDNTAYHVLVLHNAPTLVPDHPDAESERDVVETASVVTGTLSKNGYRVSQLGLTDDPAPLFRLCTEDRPDAVFNFYEGVATRSSTEPFMAGILDLLQIPYTGCPATTLALARDKPRTKLLLQGAGIPTARFVVIRSLPLPPLDLAWPVIVKPGAEDASVGLDHGSVVTSATEVSARVELLLDRYGPPVLVEEFIDGREFNVAIVERPELQVLPFSEIVFHPRSPGHWPLVTYAAKWDEGSEDDLATEPRCPAQVETALAMRLQEIALEAFHLLGCKGYARVDVRVNAKGEPFVLEVNPNPDFHPAAGLTRALGVAGISHEQFTLELVRQLLPEAAASQRGTGQM